MELMFHGCLETVILIFSTSTGNTRTKSLNPMALVASVFKTLHACQLHDRQ
jgi:hypothetical protein